MKGQVSLFVLGYMCGIGSNSMIGQELYPNSEPASIIPKNVLGVRLMNEAYTTKNRLLAWNGVMFMYGVSSKLMLTSMLTGSNHHGTSLPENFITQDFSGRYLVSRGDENETYKFESAGLGFRYRFLNKDGDHKHLRMAIYGNGVYGFQPHDEAETTLMGDNKAVGGGLIATALLRKLAVSLTGGIIKPFRYVEKRSPYSINYGQAVNYSLSFGYLLYPFKYKNFKETNVNLYAEFVGKSYAPLSIGRDEKIMPMDRRVELCGGNYLELRPAIQFIIKSNLRVDLATAIPLIGKSYIRAYPLYMFNLQYYFFL
jgi:hypothetical protein